MSEYWEYELSDAYKRIDALGADLALNAKMLARQCDLARGAETEQDAVQSENERLRQELAMVRETGIEATREIMSELREVAEILGGPGNTKPAIDLAREAEAENERLRERLAQSMDSWRVNAEDSRRLASEVVQLRQELAEANERAEKAVADLQWERVETERLGKEVEDWQNERNYAQGNADDMEVELHSAESALQDLLAIVHRDGGHHTGDVGLKQSVANAHQTWANLIAQAEEAANLRSALAEARAVLEWYREKAEAIARYTEKQMIDAQVAVMVELSLDAGRRAALANTETAGERWEAMRELATAVQMMIDNPPDTDNECGEWALSRVDLWQKVVDKAEALAELEARG